MSKNVKLTVSSDNTEERITLYFKPTGDLYRSLLSKLEIARTLAEVMFNNEYSAMKQFRYRVEKRHMYAAIGSKYNVMRFPVLNGIKMREPFIVNQMVSLVCRECERIYDQLEFVENITDDNIDKFDCNTIECIEFPGKVTISKESVFAEGIGDIVPTNFAEVIGCTNSHGFTIYADSNGWCRLVFTTSYKIHPISNKKTGAVEVFIHPFATVVVTSDKTSVFPNYFSRSDSSHTAHFSAIKILKVIDKINPPDDFISHDRTDDKAKRMRVILDGLYTTWIFPLLKKIVDLNPSSITLRTNKFINTDCSLLFEANSAYTSIVTNILMRLCSRHELTLKTKSYRVDHFVNDVLLTNIEFVSWLKEVGIDSDLLK